MILGKIIYKSVSVSPYDIWDTIREDKRLSIGNVLDSVIWMNTGGILIDYHIRLNEIR